VVELAGPPQRERLPPGRPSGSTSRRPATSRARSLVAEESSDGLTLDNEGNLYLADKGVLVFDRTGRQVEHIQIPD
jgi:sugar lactone lactonase YvrE